MLATASPTIWGSSAAAMSPIATMPTRRLSRLTAIDDGEPAHLERGHVARDFVDVPVVVSGVLPWGTSIATFADGRNTRLTERRPSNAHHEPSQGHRSPDGNRHT